MVKLYREIESNRVVPVRKKMAIKSGHIGEKEKNREQISLVNGQWSTLYAIRKPVSGTVKFLPIHQRLQNLRIQEAWNTMRHDP